MLPRRGPERQSGSYVAPLFCYLGYVGRLRDHRRSACRGGECLRRPPVLALAEAGTRRPIKRAYCRIIIERCALDVGQGLDVAGPLIDARDPTAHERNPIEVPGTAGDEPVPRITEPLRDLAAEVARGRWPEDRHHEVWSFGYPPGAERQAEILLVKGDAPASGDIDHSPHADRRIDDKAAHRLSGLLELTLQGIVHKDQRRAQIIQKIA